MEFKRSSGLVVGPKVTATEPTVAFKSCTVLDTGWKLGLTTTSRLKFPRKFCTFSAASAEILKRFTGSDAFGASYKVPEGASRGEPGQVPATEDDISDWYTQRREVAEEQLQLKDVRTLECLIVLDPGQPPLRIGQRVRATICRTAP